MAFPYKHILLVGATSGIGKGLAECFVEAGIKVTAVGRRKDRLDEFVAKHGESKADGVVFDISKLAEIPQFAANVVNKSPDIDCLLLNAGTQSLIDFSKPETVDLAAFNAEVHVNFTSFVALTHAFLPFLIAKKTPASILFTGSNIAIVPASTMPAYSASKSALNVFTLCLREQLRDTGVRVLEISPPPVQTELHDYMGDSGRKLGMPLDEFTKHVYQELTDGHDQIVLGSIGPADKFNEVVAKRRELFEFLAKILRGGH